MIRPFQLHRPATIGEAAALLAELPNAALYRGGTELLQVMKLGLARFDHLIDLKGIAELRGISVAPDGSVWIGAATTHREIEQSPIIRERFPVLAELERHVANPRVRTMGSIGGNLCFAEPHSDPATFFLVADARLELRGPSGTRTLGIDEFVVGALTTALEPGEILAAIILPAAAPGTTFGYRRIAFVERPDASVACHLTVEGGVVSDARLAVGSLGDRPVLVPDAATELVGSRVADLVDAPADRPPFPAIAAAIAKGCDVADEPTVSAEYRTHLAGVLARRAVAAAAGANDDE